MVGFNAAILAGLFLYYFVISHSENLIPDGRSGLQCLNRFVDFTP